MASLSATALSPEQLASKDAARLRSSRIFTGSIFAIGIATSMVVLALILTIIIKGAPAISWEFLSTGPTQGMSAGGIWPMIRGSLLLMAGTLMFVIPLGILGGICLAEYAGQNSVTRLMRACVTSLAGTPSIVYGLFGFSIFVLLFDFKLSLISGWCTLAILALPVIILSTEAAIKAVPDSLIEGALALGLSRWQTMAKVVLPNALPGIMTGIVLSTGRAAGEAPAILFTASIYYSTAKLNWGTQMLMEPVANLPYHLAEGYRQGGVIPEKIIWGTCLCLMLLVLSINFGAIIIRSRIRSRT